MPYIKEICVAGRILEVRKYHTLRYNCKGKRGKDDTGRHVNVSRG